MEELFARIRSLVTGGRYIVGQHAVERLEERGILEWQVVDGIEHGRFLRERPDGQPHPVVEIEQTLADGTHVLAVWAYMRSVDCAKLVTVYFL